MLYVRMVAEGCLHPPRELYMVDKIKVHKGCTRLYDKGFNRNAVMEWVPDVREANNSKFTEEDSREDMRVPL